MHLPGTATTLPMKATVLRRSAAGCWTAGCGGCAMRLVRRRRVGRRRRASHRDVVDLFDALRTTIRERSLPLVLFEDLLSAFRQDVPSRDTPHGSSCSTTVAVLQTRSEGLCCGSPGHDDARFDQLVRRHLHGASADEFLAGSQDRFRSGPHLCAVRGPDCERGGRRAISQRARVTPAWQRVLADDGVTHPKAVRTRAARSVMPFRGVCGTSSARRGLGACAFSTASRLPASTS